ncbi:gluconate 2-dehydrogenase subunit 3 family protein [Rhodovarius crocodyli]|uniref:Gluconate 2-dehydrogenase subunit 3 family protein n=1 Tax=Rhodovarius crocodyli TaxID=1979269 RepID=A0A437MJC0_9PROT|nr:gluconate 2-dehydrogenase subunit 3 family protein [Rhodovarius crocodyli]RVT97742.1 gluconate 2-dehydrogenase subunit 3 family protein [Rhodovarius crocodyli]
MLSPPNGSGSRRELLASVTAISLAAGAHAAAARSYSGALPFRTYSADPPRPVLPGAWLFFTQDEAVAVEAMVDRLIPADDLSVGGKEAGCAVFIDRQLAGPYGNSSRLYTRGPFAQGLPTQGYQGEANPAQRYRAGLAAIDSWLKREKNRPFAALPAEEQDAFLTGLDKNEITLPQGGAGFFNLLLQNTMEGFFSDPVYGGNRGMASWRMLGFPGTRYDYRDWVSRHNQRYPQPPVSIMGAAEWSPRAGAAR